MKPEDACKIIDAYHRFDDGILELFSYVFLRDGSMAVRLELYARNHAAAGDVWRTVRIVVGGAGEVRSNFTGGETNVICSGVKLLELDGVICLDVDGEYGARDPVSMDEVRKYSPCYVVGETVEIVELD
ncbi:hypothetical protein P5705_12410 [Pseudomonas entomophila]|uniref:hypothetical protein n=1 Tax=Pseudomonas entomophila TaxID=312306 RepID=UPI002405E565|nr:hypothetical protein [Pseudomonas entomophila]MDF9618451.1 hypothetical protein [Pseudomonas entomophila]